MYVVFSAFNVNVTVWCYNIAILTIAVFNTEPHCALAYHLYICYNIIALLGKNDSHLQPNVRMVWYNDVPKIVRLGEWMVYLYCQDFCYVIVSCCSS